MPHGSDWISLVVGLWGCGVVGLWGCGVLPPPSGGAPGDPVWITPRHLNWCFHPQRLWIHSPVVIYGPDSNWSHFHTVTVILMRWRPMHEMNSSLALINSRDWFRLIGSIDGDSFVLPRWCWPVPNVVDNGRTCSIELICRIWCHFIGEMLRVLFYLFQVCGFLLMGFDGCCSHRSSWTGQSKAQVLAEILTVKFKIMGEVVEEVVEDGRCMPRTGRSSRGRCSRCNNKMNSIRISY